MQSDITVHVVHGEDEIRNALIFLLVRAGFAVRVHPSAAELFEQPRTEGKSCLLTGLPVPGLDGVERLYALKICNREMPTIVIGANVDVEFAVQAMKTGAADVIAAPFSDDHLVAAIGRAAGRAELSADRSGDRASERICRLTEREKQVLTRIVDGLQNKQIAFDLGISARTVEVHRANLMAKMKARNLPQLMKMVIPLHLSVDVGLQSVLQS